MSDGSTQQAHPPARRGELAADYLERTCSTSLTDGDIEIDVENGRASVEDRRRRSGSPSTVTAKDGESGRSGPTERR